MAKIDFGTGEELATVRADQLIPGVIVDGYRFGLSTTAVVQDVKLTKRTNKTAMAYVTVADFEHGKIRSRQFYADRPIDTWGKLGES